MRIENQCVEVTRDEVIEAIYNRDISELYIEEGLCVMKSISLLPIAEILNRQCYKTTKIALLGHFSFPPPETAPPSIDTTYFYPRMDYLSSAVGCRWRGDQGDLHRLENDLVHLTEEGAIAHCEALTRINALPK